MLPALVMKRLLQSIILLFLFLPFPFSILLTLPKSHRSFHCSLLPSLFHCSSSSFSSTPHHYSTHSSVLFFISLLFVLLSVDLVLSSLPLTGVLPTTDNCHSLLIFSLTNSHWEIMCGRRRDRHSAGYESPIKENCLSFVISSSFFPRVLWYTFCFLHCQMGSVNFDHH